MNGLLIASYSSCFICEMQLLGIHDQKERASNIFIFLDCFKYDTETEKKKSVETEMSQLII